MRALMLLMLLALPAAAQDDTSGVVADLSQTRINIDANFDGSEILVFGAVKRDRPGLSGTAPIDVIVTVSGPLRPLTVRRKDRVAGIWVNVESAEIDLAPSFYAVATSGPLAEILSEVENLRHAITVPRAIRAVDAGAADSPAFTRALIRIQERVGAYRLAEGSVEVIEGTLFHTAIELPANLVEGGYAARFFVLREGRVLASYDTMVRVEKVGLERFLYRLAHDRPAIYGVLSLAIAILAGWGASAAFRWIRP